MQELVCGLWGGQEGVSDLNVLAEVNCVCIYVYVCVYVFVFVYIAGISYV
jgi:hypothetical protein